MNELVKFRDAAGLAFSRSEYTRRISALSAYMQDARIDATFIDLQEHIQYLFGYLPTGATHQIGIVTADGDAHLLVRAFDEPSFLHQSWVTSYETFADTDDTAHLAGHYLSNIVRASTVGYEGDSNMSSPGWFARLREACGRCGLVDIQDAVWDATVIKSDEELSYIRKAAHIASSIASGVLNAVRPGASEREMAVLAYELGLRAGADNDRIALFGYGDTVANMHGRLGHRTLESGNLFYIEAVPQVNGYSGRIMRPAYVGIPSAEVVAVAEKLIAVQDEQIGGFQVGARAGDVDAVVREAVLACGLRREYRHQTSYTTGLHGRLRTTDLRNSLQPSANWRIQAGMVFHVDVMACGMPFSETVLVTHDGPDVLTTVPRRLVATG